MQTWPQIPLSWRRLALVLFSGGVISSLLAGCGGPTPTPTPTPPPPPSITLIQNPWTASKLNVAIAKILIEEQLQSPVTIIETSEQEEWQLLATSQAQAVLEVWPSSPQAEIQQYMYTDKLVDYGGPLGVKGKIGWYIPSYLILDHPELANWEAYKDPEKTALFRTPASGEKGQFLAGDPTWGQHDAEVIQNLGLDLTVVTAGDEATLLQQVEAAYQQRQPILFYFWTPHAIHAKYSLTEVALPPFSNACYAQAANGGIDCDYPVDNLFKAFAPDLDTYAPRVYEFLKNFSYDNATQIALIAAVENDGQTVENVARVWVDNNAAIWQKWLVTSTPNP